MKAATFLRRFLVPRPVVSLMCWLRYRARVSPRAEVDLSPQLALGRLAQVSSFCKIKAANGTLRIGQRTHIAAGCFLSAGPGGLSVGDDCLIGPNCVLVSGPYVYSDLSQIVRAQGQTSKGTLVGNNVLIGANSVILDGSQVGNNVIVNAGSVVSARIPDNVVIAGNPARVIFERR
jgi:acetyltransferase-like isoleucine patch superfamily enzyme